MTSEAGESLVRVPVVCWSHRVGAFNVLKQVRQLSDVGNCIIPGDLETAIETALKSPEAVVLLHPKGQAEHDLVEEFLLQVDRQQKINSHYCIVVSRHGKQFKSGVQSHSVINTFDYHAILRAILHGITVLSKQTVESGLPPLPTLKEYYNLPSFPKATVPLDHLSSEDREELSLALTDLWRSAGAKNFDPLEHVAHYLRARRNTEVGMVDLSELRRFGPDRRDPVDLAMCPPPGHGVLAFQHKLYALMKVPARTRIGYAWVTEQNCCILTWNQDPASSENKASFALALVYAVLRTRAAA